MSLVTSPSRTVFSLVVVLILVSLACNAPGLSGRTEEEPAPEMESADPGALSCAVYRNLGCKMSRPANYSDWINLAVQ